MKLPINDHLYAYEIFVNDRIVGEGRNGVISPVRRLCARADATKPAVRGPQAYLGLWGNIRWIVLG